MSARQAEQAEALLRRAELAQRTVTSERFLVRVGVDVAGRSATMTMEGGVYLRGERAGDASVTMTAAGVPELGELDLTFVRRGASPPPG